MLVRDIIFLVMSLFMGILSLLIYQEHGNDTAESLLTIIIFLLAIEMLLVIPEIIKPKSELAKFFNTRIL